MIQQHVTAPMSGTIDEIIAGLQELKSQVGNVVLNVESGHNNAEWYHEVPEDWVIKVKGSKSDRKARWIASISINHDSANYKVGDMSEALHIKEDKVDLILGLLKSHHSHLVFEKTRKPR